MDTPLLFENYFDISNEEKTGNASLMIPLGVNDQGILEQAEITHKHRQHILVTGRSGAGKSVYLRTVLAGLLLRTSAYQVNFWLEDNGMCEFNHFADTAAHIKRVNTCIDPESPIAFVDALEAELETRLVHLASLKKRSFYACCRETNRCPFPRLVIMIDGFDHFMRCLSERDYPYARKMERIARYASTCGITFVVSTQETSSPTHHIPASLLEWFGIRITIKQSPNRHGILYDSETGAGICDLPSGEMFASLPPARKLNMLYISPEIERQIIEKSR